MVVNMYRFPVIVFGRGPTQSMSTWWNGSSKADIGFRGLLESSDTVF